MVCQYDLVLDFETTALMEDPTLYKFGPDSNNPSRYHTREQAQQLAPVISSAWAAHERTIRINVEDSFSDKVDVALQSMLDNLPKQLADRAAAKYLARQRSDPSRSQSTG